MSFKGKSNCRRSTGTKSGKGGKDGAWQNTWITQIWWLSPYRSDEIDLDEIERNVI